MTRTAKTATANLVNRLLNHVRDWIPGTINTRYGFFLIPSSKIEIETTQVIATMTAPGATTVLVDHIIIKVGGKSFPGFRVVYWLAESGNVPASEWTHITDCRMWAVLDATAESTGAKWIPVTHRAMGSKVPEAALDYALSLTMNELVLPSNLAS